MACEVDDSRQLIQQASEQQNWWASDDNYVFLDHLSWDNFNESGDFQDQIEAYKMSIQAVFIYLGCIIRRGKELLN